MPAHAELGRGLAPGSTWPLLCKPGKERVDLFAYEEGDTCCLQRGTETLSGCECAGALLTGGCGVTLPKGKWGSPRWPARGGRGPLRVPGEGREGWDSSSASRKEAVRGSLACRDVDGAMNVI